MSHPPTNPRYALIANRQTGQLDTVTQSEAHARATSGDWMIVCTEPEELIETDYAETPDPLRVILWHHHDSGQAQPWCPVIDPEISWAVLPPEDWTAEDLKHIHDHACLVLDDIAAIWTIALEGRRTKIEISTFHTITRTKSHRRGRALHPHALRLEFAGRPNAATIAWIVGQSEGFQLSAGIRTADHSYPRAARQPRPEDTPTPTPAAGRKPRKARAC